MTNLIYDCIINKKTTTKPIWFMRQAGRYLPEFRQIRKLNPDFVKLCLNENLSAEITIQPLKRFNLSAAIIFSDILMVPYGLNQKVNFIKNFGPKLGDIDLENLIKINEKEFIDKLKPIYNCIKKVRSNKLIEKKNLIGFVGAPWTLLVYMINKKSPKNNIAEDFFDNKNLIDKILNKLEDFLKIHIENQIKSGADVIQIFDSWAGLLDKNVLSKYAYEPTIKLVNFVRSKKIPVICFPRGIKNYKEYTEIVKPDAICIDYEVDPLKIKKEINIPVQGGLNPNILLSDKETLKKEALKYLNIFKDHPYIFNLGHGVLPGTDPMMIDYLVKLVNDY
jgi:uroporphyrinogen decarboxylase